MQKKFIYHALYYPRAWNCIILNNIFIFFFIKRNVDLISSNSLYLLSGMLYSQFGTLQSSFFTLQNSNTVFVCLNKKLFYKNVLVNSILEKYYSFLFPWINVNQGEAKFYQVSQPSRVIYHANNLRLKVIKVSGLSQFWKYQKWVVYVIEGILKGL